MGICYYILGTSVGREAKATKLREQAAWRTYPSQDPGHEEGEMLTLSAVIWDKISSAKYRL